MRRVLFVVAAMLGSLLLVIPAHAAGPQTVTAWLSSYDYWNNSPPGYGIEYPRDEGYPTVHDWACCRQGGSYSDPITFAAQPDELAPGTRIYVPSLRKYFIKEDLCTGCYTASKAWQFDLWVGGVSQAQNASQDPANIVNLWERVLVIIDPPAGLPVTATWLRAEKT